MFIKAVQCFINEMLSLIYQKNIIFIVIHSIKKYYLELIKTALEVN